MALSDWHKAVDAGRNLSPEDKAAANDRLIALVKIEAAKPSGPAMDHEPTAKFIRVDYWNKPGTADLNEVPRAEE